ncbi:MAG: DAK2 domain-containing protein, partial [Lachnospiraceae bacterium]|nr:DAK2 domain-containing protein [Lachnospiraceae bacterium]
MSITQLDAKALKEAFISGLLKLKEHKEEVDSLNVFPVPDGDTGTNMVMTMEGGAHAIQDGKQERIDDFLKRFARGVLLGARGNSGVILSQFFKGLSVGADQKETLTVPDFICAFQKG